MIKFVLQSAVTKLYNCGRHMQREEHVMAEQAGNYSVRARCLGIEQEMLPTHTEKSPWASGEVVAHQCQSRLPSVSLSTFFHILALCRVVLSFNRCHVC